MRHSTGPGSAIGEHSACSEQEGVHPTAYSLDPDRLNDDVHYLAVTPGGWSVWFAERGERKDEVFFETEDEACDELLLRIVSDPTTGQR